jgi:monofunctional biosynthetic peptidoglycan transglycosylase
MDEVKTLSAQTLIKTLGTKRLLVRRWKWLVGMIATVAFVLWFVPWVPLLCTDSIEVTRLDAKGKPIQVEVGPKTKQWAPIKSISRHLVNAVVVAEDAKFFQHHGFDIQAMRHAYIVNQKTGRFSRGGSTISQQVIKMAFLTREKTYTRKIREAIGTALMEMILTKEEILEWYLNLTEFGGGIYGVKQAGLYYFKTRPELLTTVQAIHLALVIPSPNKWSSGLRAKNLTPFGHRRFARITRLLRKAGYISDVHLQTILAQGNFGGPIAGYEPVQKEDDTNDDDCKGDKDCSTEEPAP